MAINVLPSTLDVVLDERPSKFVRGSLAAIRSKTSRSSEPAQHKLVTSARSVASAVAGAYRRGTTILDRIAEGCGSLKSNYFPWRT